MSLLPAKYHFSAWEGATFRKTISWLTAGPGSSPVDVTGFTGVMDIDFSGGAATYSLSTENGGIVMGDTAGTIALLIPADAIPPLTSGVYELLVTDVTGTGDTFGLLWGSFSVERIAA